MALQVLQVHLVPLVSQGPQVFLDLQVHLVTLVRMVHLDQWDLLVSQDLQEIQDSLERKETQEQTDFLELLDCKVRLDYLDLLALLEMLAR